MGLFAAQEDTGQEAVSRTKTIDMRCPWNFLIATSRREWEIQWECRTPLRDRVSCVRVTSGGRRTAQRGPLLLGSFGPHPSVWFPGFLIRRPWAGETSHGASPQPRATEMQNESPGDWLRNQPNKFSFRGSSFARLVSLCTSVIKQCVFFFPYWEPLYLATRDFSLMGAAAIQGLTPETSEQKQLHFHLNCYFSA